MPFRVLRGLAHGLLYTPCLAPPYLSQLVRVADLPGRRRLHVPAFPSVYCRTALVSCCSIRSLELLGTGHSFVALFTHFRQRLKTFFP